MKDLLSLFVPNYLFFEYESFQNVRAQSSLANAVQNVLATQQMQNSSVSK